MRFWKIVVLGGLLLLTVGLIDWFVPFPFNMLLCAVICAGLWFLLRYLEQKKNENEYSDLRIFHTEKDTYTLYGVLDGQISVIDVFDTRSQARTKMKECHRTKNRPLGITAFTLSPQSGQPQVYRVLEVENGMISVAAKDLEKEEARAMIQKLNREREQKEEKQIRKEEEKILQEIEND